MTMSSGELLHLNVKLSNLTYQDFRGLIICELLIFCEVYHDGKNDSDVTFNVTFPHSGSLITAL